MQPRPIDVILLLDQSGSMGSSTDSNSRLYKAKQAAKVFVDQMNATNGDRVGIMTYNQSGWLYQGLTNNLVTAKNKISSITGNTNGAHTNMRQGLHDALKNEAQNANSGSVRAVIHMTDGDWSMAGDPLARQGSLRIRCRWSRTPFSLGRKCGESKHRRCIQVFSGYRWRGEPIRIDRKRPEWSEI